MAASERGRFHAAGLELTMPNAGKMFAEQAGSSSVKLRSSATMQYDVAAASSHQFLVNGATVAQIGPRSEEHTSELQSLMRISYAVFCLKKKKKKMIKHIKQKLYTK